MSLKARILFPPKKDNVDAPEKNTTSVASPFAPRTYSGMSKPTSAGLDLEGFHSIDQTTPAGGAFASVRPNVNKFKDILYSSKTSLHGAARVGRPTNDANMNATGGAQVNKRQTRSGHFKGFTSTQVSQNHIIATLGALSDAELGNLLMRMPQSLVKAVFDGYDSRHPSVLSKAVPATAFVKFRKLPKEIRIIIWTMALPDLIEAFPDFHMNAVQRFITDGPRESIFTICSDFQKMFYMSPIYLTHLHRPTDEEVEVIYIRPELDILYLNIEALNALDIEAFTARSENQIIQNLALPAVKVEGIRWCGKKFGRVSGTRTFVGDLVRGLKNLKKLYVVDGHTTHVESEVEYWSRSGSLTKYEISLENCKHPSETADWSPPSTVYSPPAKPWNSDYTVAVIEKFNEEVKREKSGKYKMIFGEEWSEPEVICKELKRYVMDSISAKAYSKDR